MCGIIISVSLLQIFNMSFKSISSCSLVSYEVEDARGGGGRRERMGGMGLNPYQDPFMWALDRATRIDEVLIR